MDKQNQNSSMPEDIYPLHILDDTKLYRFFVSGLMHFNDVLDTKKLHNALSKLLEIGDWRKLGGRLRIKRNGKLEIHVPRPFTAKQPAVAFTHDIFDMTIEKHPVACRFPKPTDGPSTQPISSDFQSFVMRPDHPTTIEEMIRQDVPQLSLHITSFSDATLVALTWPHTMMDAAGHQALLHAWSSVLAGQEEEVPLVLGAHKDILEDVSSNYDGDQEEFGPDRMRMRGMGKLKFMFQYLWEEFWNSPRETRVIFLPRNIFVRLQKRIRAEVAESAHTSDQKSFVSDGDILAAWATRAVASTMPKPRPITIVSFVNARFRLPPLIESRGIYLQNMVLAGYAFLSAHLARGPVGPIALSHRRHLDEQGTEQQTFSLLKTVRQDIESDGSPNVFYGEPHASLMIVNNLTKLGIIKAANFGPAVLSQGDKEESRSNPPGTMVTVQNYFHPVSGGPNLFCILGKDYGGNYWLQGCLLPRVWEIIEKELEDM
ncbi:hypothetical protein N7532_004788 [Penicillium argentinense]|uniref:Uncharacterized protein n=1 Tax=Penicillium argentinense TaxID=1131581 RepID=A0A9W9FQ08_9EURO|nr:uncharacterized protein N7532_004788 [Penicillium argentinense]KAJ5104259.1 hypothetical protein N7532_004788 [Penicillium argentinense]